MPTSPAALRRLALLLPLCGFGLLLAPTSARCASFVLAPTALYSTGVGSYDVKVADLNQDGKPDILAAIYDGAKVCVLLNNGTGQFPSVTSYAGGSCVALDIADYDGDGLPDVASANYDQGTVSVRKNLGGGVLGAPTNYLVGPQARDLVSADLDGDGFLDLAVATNSARVWLLKGHGPAGFESGTAFLLPAGVKGIDAGDIDGDGRVDLVVAEPTGNRVEVLRNTGSMTFSLGAPVPMGANTSDVVLRDLDNDGDLDLAASNEDGTVGVSRNSGGGVFGVRVLYAVGHLSQSITVADFDGDHVPDLLVSNYSENSVTVLPGTGGAVFGAGVSGASSGGVRSAAAGDFDGDGRRDVVTGDFDAGTLHVLSNQAGPDPTFRLDPAGTYTTGPSSYDVKLADLDGDGSLDVLSALYTLGKIVVLRNNGAGLLFGQTSYPGGSPCALATLDYDQDGRRDVVSANFNQGTISLRRNLGLGALSAPTDYSMGTSTRDLVVADFDGDGRADVAAATSGRVFFRRGTVGALGSASSISVGSANKAIAAGDLNGDGRPDIVVLDAPGGVAYILRNQGSMLFSIQSALTTGADPSDVALSDLDGDGDLDIAVASEHSVALVFKNQGGFIFAAPRSYPIGPLAQSIDVADFNLDGRPDLLVSCYPQAKVSVLLQGPDGSFLFAVDGAAGAGVRSAAAGNLDPDGRPDVVTGDDDGGTIHVLRNYPGAVIPPPPPPPPATCPGTRLATPDHPSQAIVGDFDGDGVTDVAIACESGQMSFIHGIVGNPSGPRYDLNAGTNPQSIAAGDLDGDGIPELVVASAGDHALSVFRKRASAIGFEPLATLPVGGAPQFVIAADLNHDGRADLATANDAGPGAPGSITILFNDPHATWRPEPEPIEPQESQDPDPTPVGGNPGPAGGSNPRVDIPVGAGACMLAAADLNADSEVDLVVVECGASTVSILYGLGGGRFHPPVPLPLPSVGRWVAIGDLNKDGRPDIALADPVGSVLRVVWNAATNPFTTSTILTTEIGTRSVAIGDINNDSFQDLVYATDPDGIVGTRLGMGGGVFRDGPSCLAAALGRSIALGTRSDGGLDAYMASNGEAVVVQRSFPTWYFARSGGDATEAGAGDVARIEFGLGRPAPNPATGANRIAFGLPAEARVRLAIYDVRGRLVRPLVDGVLPAGRHERAWDGTDTRGARVGPGVYFYRLEAPMGQRVERLILLGGGGR